VDQINKRYGRDTVRFGVQHRDARWRTKFMRRSSRYTTRLNEALRVT
jgi:Domain of unknown function (DUF4113)